MITTQQPITSCCYFHNRYAVEKQSRENSKGICCAFVIPLALKKHVFNTVIFSKEALGVFLASLFSYSAAHSPSFILPISHQC